MPLSSNLYLHTLTQLVMHSVVNLACRLVKAGLRAICSTAVLYLFIIFNDSFQTSYLKIYLIDFFQICRIDRTMAVDDQSEGISSWQGIFVAFIYRTAWDIYFCGPHT